MIARSAIAILLAIVPALTLAQNVKVEPETDPVLEAIQKFKKRDKDKPNEVTVTLDDGGIKPLDLVPEPAEGEPVLVSGTSAPAEDADTPISDELPPEPEAGLAVRVENLQTGKGTIDASKVKLSAPFPAKPLSQAPAGWHLESSDAAPPFTREVELSKGSKITLTIRPHLLVPDADGVDVFGIAEPGYEHSLGYRQTETVGAILSTSIRQLDEDSKQLGNAIDRLQQLLVSLPAPEPTPATNKK